MRYYFIKTSIHSWLVRGVGGLITSRNKNWFDIKILNSRRID